MKAAVHPLRVLLKTGLLFVIVNIAFALLDPPIGKITLYNHVVPGRLRFPYEEKPAFYLVGYNAPIYEDFDAMFGTHVISQSKPASEFRLVLLGDSATWGFGLPAGQALSEQINRLHIRSCDGREIHAYNLGYPFSYLTRDLLILDRAMEYQPDMVLWLVTLSSLEPKPAETLFVAPHAQRYLELDARYGLELTHFSPPIRQASFWEKTVIGQRKRLKNIVFMQALGVLWAATGVDDHESLQPLPGVPGPDVADDLAYEGRRPAEKDALFESLMMNVLTAGFGVAGDVPFLLANEPIFVATGQNHLIRYNGFYPRWVYDEYRERMSEWAADEGHAWLDYWNALPPEDFTDQYFHRRPSGEQRFAGLLAPDIEKFACP